ncbi:MAG: hypothetical protein WA432_03265 [Candidatus Babeliaceae bacterium]
MKKFLLLPIFGLMYTGLCLSAGDDKTFLVKFEFLNKTDAPIQIFLGINPTVHSSAIMQIVNPKAKFSADITNKFKLLLREILPVGRPVRKIGNQETHPAKVAFLYEFTPTPGQTIYVRLVSSGSFGSKSFGSKFEPQTFLFDKKKNDNNISKNDIKLVRTIDTESYTTGGSAKSI